jgi:hypothetical protein
VKSLSMANFTIKLSLLYSFRYLLISLILLPLLIWPQSVAGQETPITASVNRNELSTDELVTLTVTVVDNSAQQPRPILPEMDGLAVIDLTIGTNMSMVNGQIRTEVVYTYKLQPRRIGLLTIPPISVKIDDKTFQSPPISLTVTQGAAPAPSPGNAGRPNSITLPVELEGQDFFVEALVDLADPYIGQQLIYTFRFYQAIRLYREPQHDMPIFAGFTAIGLPVREYNLTVEDKTYLITEIRTALFPEVEGVFTLSPARLIFPGNYFEKPLELETEPVTIQVKPLPDNAPPGFRGAVGQYQIEAWFSPQVAVLNQPSTLAVAITGAGNISALPEPVWPVLKGWRFYDSLDSFNIDTKGEVLSGTRVFERLIISENTGDITIPQTKFVYFDPVTGEYQTISSRSIPVRVIPVPTPSPVTATPAPAIPSNPSDTAVTPDPHQLESQTLSQAAAPSWGTVVPAAAVLFWAVCGAIPIAALLGASAVWVLQKRQTPKKVQKAALQIPAKKTHPVLLGALAEAGNNFKAVSQALNNYLSEVLGVSTRGLTHSDLSFRLQERGLNKTLIERVKDCLIRSEIGRYGPKNEDEGWTLLTQTDELLFKLDAALKG